MIPKTKEKPKRENFKSFDKFSAAMVAWRKSKPKAGATKTTRTRKGSKYITTTMVWNGSKWVKKGDSSLVPSRAGKNEGDTKANKKLKIKAQQEKDKKIPKVPVDNGSGNGGSTTNGDSTKNGKTTKNGGKTKKAYVDVDAADKTAEKVFRGSSSVEKAKKTHAKKDQLKIKKGSARNFIKTKKGFARRGTPMAKRAEERERKRKALAAKGYMKNR